MASKPRRFFAWLRLISILTLIFLCLSPLLLIGVNLTQDRYPASKIDFSCFQVFRLRAMKSGVSISSLICITTNDTRSQLSTWYEGKGWSCISPCVWMDSAEIGFIRLDVFKGFGSNFDGAEGRPALFENYMLSFGSE